MKKIFIILSVLTIIILFFISLITTNEPFKWIDSLTVYSFGYPKFILYWCCYSIVALSILG